MKSLFVCEKPVLTIREVEYAELITNNLYAFYGFKVVGNREIWTFQASLKDHKDITIPFSELHAKEECDVKDCLFRGILILLMTYNFEYEIPKDQ